VATATLFGGGTLVVVAEPRPLVENKSLAALLVETFAAVASGNGLAFIDTVDGTAQRPASLKTLREAVAEAGGEVREFKAPTRDGMARWIGERARERAIRISPAAAAMLAERVGARVSEKDIDRSRQSELALAELEKLALYRLDEEIGPEDVKALVAEAVPGSNWAFLDAVGMRHAERAADLADRLADVPAPLFVTRLHRRIKELIDVADLLASGESEPELMRTLDIKSSFRAQLLAQQARAWTLPELEAALAGLLELDSSLKRHAGEDDLHRRAVVTLWIAERVRRPDRR